VLILNTEQRAKMSFPGSQHDICKPNNRLLYFHSHVIFSVSFTSTVYAGVYRVGAYMMKAGMMAGRLQTDYISIRRMQRLVILFIVFMR